MSTFRVILCVVLLALLAVFVGAPFIFEGETVQGSIVSPSAPTAGSPPTSNSRPTAAAEVPLGPIVGLAHPVIFPVKNGERLAGHVRAKQGTHVEMISEEGSEVIVRLVNSSVRVPRSAVIALPEYPANEVNFGAQARSAGERVLAYWFGSRLKPNDGAE